MRSIKQLADNHSRYYYDPAIAKVARDSYEKGAKCVLDHLSMTISVSEYNWLRDNLRKMIEQLKK